MEAYYMDRQPVISIKDLKMSYGSKAVLKYYKTGVDKFSTPVL